MKKLGNILFSMTTAVSLMAVFAIAIAWATFIENDYGTESAKKLIYGATWFELLLFAIAINISGNVIKYKLVSRKKWSILLFHLAFIFILAGGGITRFFGLEGSMHIREGGSSNQITLNKTYLILKADYKGLKQEVYKDIRLTPIGSNRFNEEIEIGGRKVLLNTELYIPNAQENLRVVDEGLPAFSMFVMDRKKSGHELDLLKGDRSTIENISYSFNQEKPGTITFLNENNQIKFIATDTVLLRSMMTRDTSILQPWVKHVLTEKTMYRINGQVFVIKSYLPSVQKSIESIKDKETGMQGLVVRVSTEGVSKRISLINKMGVGIPNELLLDDIKLNVSFGSKMMEIPFSLELKDFVLERYPGSNSPSSYASEVLLKDPANRVINPYRIYMNHTLKYKGYRFFQSSYDRDERGTILSVSQDYWGTWFTYLGYLLMGLGMVLTLLNKNSRFALLLRQSKQLKERKNAGLIGLFMILLTSGIVQNVSSQNNVLTQKQHLKEFNALLVQDNSGRIQPMASMSAQVMRKITRKETFNGMSASNVMMGMLNNPQHWQQEPMIKISNSTLAADLAAPTGYMAYADMFSGGKYRLKQLVDASYHKEPNKRNKYDKEVLNVDERINILYQIYNGSFFKLFPIPQDEKHNWTSAQAFPVKRLQKVETSPVKIYQAYLRELTLATTTRNWQHANDLLSQIKKYQIENGGNYLPGERKIALEVFYSKANIFGKLSMIYLLVGIILLFIQLITVFSSKINIKGVSTIGTILAGIIFLAYTAGIAMRWIISNHAPWSNGYETMVFVGWATALAGLLFAKQSGVTLAITNLLVGIMLMVAGLSWMNPEITPLVPVLKSYWLIVHVAVITSSYGFLAIGALLGLLNLFLIIFRTDGNNHRISFQIKELSIIIEITLIVGLILLTAGSFLGGIWANESWGRYWGWDPKETWALVTVLVYSVVLHLNKIPSVHGSTLFNGLSLLSFSSVLMTFFGVNYYLSGLHSYAQGDAPPVPNAIYYSCGFVLILIYTAYLMEKRRPLKAIS